MAERNYESEFVRLRQAVADCSPELKAFVEQIASAPIWDDDEARRIIGDATERLDARLEDGGELSVMMLAVELLQMACLDELRGVVPIKQPSLLELYPKIEVRRDVLTKQMALPMGVNDTPLFADTKK